MRFKIVRLLLEIIPRENTLIKQIISSHSSLQLQKEKILTDRLLESGIFGEVSFYKILMSLITGFN